MVLGLRTFGNTIIKHRAAYLFILPIFSVFVIFTLIPVIMGFRLSFLEYLPPPRESFFVGFDNFVAIFENPRWSRALLNTFTYTFFVVLGVLIIALTISMLIFPLRKKMQSFFKSLYYLPGVTSLVIVVLQWQFIFHPTFGLLNGLLEMIGLQPVFWLSNPSTAMPSIIFMDIVRGDGAAILLILAALHTIPNSVFEAAECDGAGGVQIFWRITLPLIKPILLYLLVMGTINAFQVFIPIFLMTQGGPEFSTITVAHEIYSNAFMRSMRFGLAAAQGVFLFVVTMVVSIMYFKLFNEDVIY